LRLLNSKAPFNHLQISTPPPWMRRIIRYLFSAEALGLEIQTKHLSFEVTRESDFQQICGTICPENMQISFHNLVSRC
jgi:hypothetical protein